MTLEAGTRLGPYEITAPIGAGGMGEVYLAKDERLGRDVAIKVLPASFAADPERRARFEREAQAVAALSHPNVVAIFDTGVLDAPEGSGQIYIVMELLAGQSLRERLTAGPLPVRKAIDVAVQIARGLGAAHTKGIVHRDLKPENVFLLDDGQVKILDFGLARLDPTPDRAGATQTISMTGAGTVVGTVGYMAPEQVRGHAVDARADVFAFGAVLYEMLTGRRAFRRDTAADTMTAVLTQDPPELAQSRPDLSPALDRIVRHCLEKNANERFQNARDIAFALEALSGSNVSVSGATAVVGVATPGASRRRILLGASVLGALLLGAAAGYLGRGESSPPSAGVAEVSYQPVSFEDGFVFAARFAPDGRTVVYSADWDGQPRDVYVTSLDSPEYRSLGFRGADLLGVSRSGELAILAGSSSTFGSDYWRRGTLATASLLGGVPRAELEGVSFADFGPGDAKAVVRSDGIRATMEYPVGHVLAESPVNRLDYATPRVSPSGDYVAFFDLHLRTEILVKIFDRGGKLVATSQPVSDWWALAWTPSGEVWFAATDTSGTQTRIYGLDLAGHQRTVYRAPGSITLHDISATGDVLVSFDRGSDRVELLEAADRVSRDRSWREGSYAAGIDRKHAVLLNGSGDSAGPDGSVYFWPPDAPQPVRISDGVGLALSPDGSKALVVSATSPPRVSVVPTGVGRTEELDLGPLQNISWGGWLPDGRLVIQAERSGSGPTVYALSENGGDAVAILPAGFALTVRRGNVLSPDGSRVIAKDDAGRVMTCATAAPECRPVAGAASDDVVAGWNEDGSSLFVYSPKPGSMQVDRLDVASGRRTAWKTLAPLRPSVSGPRYVFASPDGTILYSYGRSASQLYVIRGLK